MYNNKASERERERERERGRERARARARASERASERAHVNALNFFVEKFGKVSQNLNKKNYKIFNIYIHIHALFQNMFF